MQIRLDGILNAIGSILLAFMTFLLTAQVLGRYVLGVPWPWTEELARYTLIWVSFLGAWAGARKKLHFKVLAGEDWLGKFGHWAEAILSTIALFVVVYGYLFVLPRVARTGSPILELSMGLVYAPAAVFSFLMAIDTFYLCQKKMRQKNT